MAHLFQHLHRDTGLPFNDIGIVKGRQEMCALLLAMGLRCGKRLIEKIPDQPDRDIFTAKAAGFHDFLLRRCHRHEDRALNPEMAAGIGHALRMIACTGANEMALVGGNGQPLAHGVERAANLVAAHGAQVFALQPDIRAKTV
jgi:hypothetical protein